MAFPVSHRHKLKVCATTYIVRYVSKIDLSKCPNNFKVHYNNLSFLAHVKSAQIVTTHLLTDN